MAFDIRVEHPEDTGASIKKKDMKKIMLAQYERKPIKSLEKKTIEIDDLDYSPMEYTDTIDDWF